GWDGGLEGSWGGHAGLGPGPEARGPWVLESAALVGPQPGGRGVPGVASSGPADVRRWQGRQGIADPAGDHDWVIEAVCDLDASDEVGEPVLLATAMRRL